MVLLLLVQGSHFQNQCPRDWLKIKMSLHLLALRVAYHWVSLQIQFSGTFKQFLISQYPPYTAKKKKKKNHKKTKKSLFILLYGFLSLSSPAHSQFPQICHHRNTSLADTLQIWNCICLILFFFPQWLFSVNELQRRGASGEAGEWSFGINLREFSELVRGFSAKGYNRK